MKALGTLTAGALTIVYTAVINSWTLQKLWSWFIVKTFGLPPLNLAQAYGFALIVSFLTIDVYTKKSEDFEKKSYGERLVIGLFVTTFKAILVLSLGSLVKQWA